MNGLYTMDTIDTIQWLKWLISYFKSCKSFLTKVSMKASISVIIIASFPLQTAIAHPVVYKGAYAIMSYNQAFLSDNWLNYSFRPDMAIVARGMRMKLSHNASQDHGSLNVYMPQLDYLVKRWYGEDYQANLYVWGGFGGATLHGATTHHRLNDRNEGNEQNRRNRRNGTAGLIGFEADAESRKYFGLVRYEVIPNSIHKTMHQVELRVGIAPYEAEYCEIASWFMISGRYNPKLKRNYSITPLARFFYKSVLWETGVSLKGDWMLNLMFHF